MKSEISNKQKVMNAMKLGRVTLEQVIEQTGLSENKVISAVRNLQYADDQPIRMQTESIKTRYIILDN